MSTQVKTFFTGTHRLVPPGETWNRIERAMRVAGITRVADITGLDTCDIPVALAIRPAARTLAVSSGKGVTRLLARVGAAMESIERWHAERPPDPVVIAAARDLDLPYPLDLLPLAPGSALTPHTPLEWLPGRGAVSGARSLVPRPLVRLSSVVSDGWKPPLFLATPNGLASGNSIPEATQHALLEVVERQCLLEFHGDPASAVPMAPGSVTDPTARDLLDRLDRSGNLVRLLDVTNAMGVPCYHAEIRNEAVPFTFAGAGCHTATGVALCRAITGAAQSRLGVIAGTRDDLDDDFYRMVDDPARGGERELPPSPARAATGPPARAATGPPARVAAGPPARAAAGPPRRDVAAPTFDEDVRFLAARVLESTGCEPVVVDLTSPECDVPVVKVIAPGLGFDACAGFPPGRSVPAASPEGDR